MTPFSRRIAVIGSAGQLGSDIAQVLAATKRYDVTSLTHDQMDVTDHGSVGEVLNPGRFDVVVNCAAFHRVEECEQRPDEALRVNALGALEVARACRAAGSLCAFVSTDYVFSGTKGMAYTEDDEAGPINAYGVSKVAGELFVQEAASRWLILRVASLYGKAGSRGKGGNFVETILTKARAGEPISVVNDIWMSPTYTHDVAIAVDGLIQAGATGLYHTANHGCCTWYEFACETLRLLGFEHRIEPTSSEAYASKVRRPRNSSLHSLQLERVLGRAMRPWRRALLDYLVEKGHVSAALEQDSMERT